MSITGSNNPFACEPVVFANANAIVSLGTITRDGNEFTFSVGFVWKINGVTYQNTSPVVLTIAEASTGFERIDNALLNTSNTIELQQGLESDSIALQPVAPDTNIILTSWNISGTAIGDTEASILGTQFKQKNESQKITQVLGGTNAEIELRTFGQQYYVVIGPVTSIAGFSKALITASPTAEVPYSGKDFYFENKTDHNVTLKNAFSPVDIPFNLGADLVVPANGIVWLKYNPATEKMDLFFKSWSEGSDILEYANLATFPVTGETEKIYVALDTNLTYRWSGSAYVLIGGGGKRTMYLNFPIFQNVAASTSWYALPSTGQIFTGTGYAANASLTDANDFADLSYLTPRLFVPFQHKVKSVSVHGGTNVATVSAVQFAVVTSYVSSSNSGATTIPNPLIVAQEGVFIYVAGNVNGFQKKFNNANLDTSTLNAGTDYRIVFKNANEASNIHRAMLIVEVEEVL